MGRPKHSPADRCVEAFFELDAQAREDTLRQLTQFHRHLLKLEGKGKPANNINGAKVQKDLLSGQTEQHRIS
jgi:hypothetical protein